MSNAFTYESVPPAMSLRQRDTLPTKNEVLYLSSNGQIQQVDDGQRRSGKGIYLFLAFLNSLSSKINDRFSSSFSSKRIMVDRQHDRSLSQILEHFMMAKSLLIQIFQHLEVINNRLYPY